MARPDFTLKWAGSRLSIPAISAGNYAAGWDTYLGPLPPLGDDHDYVMNLQDSRAIWLGEQMLLAVGHEWQDDVSYDAYAVVRSPVNGQLYRSLVGSNLNNEPSVSGAQWALGLDDSLNAAIATVAAAGTINLTSGAPNTSQLAISGTGVTVNGFTVAANRFFVARFAGANTLVNGGPLVTRTGANITTAAGDSCLLYATAANTVEVLCYTRVNPNSVRKVFTSGTTYNKPGGLKAIFVECQAGGGGGGGANAPTITSAVKCAAGGGSGGYQSGYILASSIGASETITVGAGGTAGSTAGGSGGAGGASSFGALITATGGGGGLGATADITSTQRGVQPAGAGGTGTGGQDGSGGVSGGIGVIFSGGLGISGAGASSRLGTGGAGRPEGSTGDAGKGYGSGGAGGIAGQPGGIDTARAGGAGAPGIVVVWEFF